MNKTYKTVWNQATRTWAVASELAKSKTKSAGGKAASTVASATMLVASVTGIATMAAPLRASAAEQAVFNDGTSNACTAINSDGTTSAVTGTAACATTIGSGTASAAGLGSGLNFASNANGAFINGGLEVFGTGVAAGSPAAYIHGQLSLFSGPGTTGAANKIVGVAAGTAATDAVNVQQLTNATRYFKAGGANDGTDDALALGRGVAIGAGSVAQNGVSGYDVVSLGGDTAVAVGYGSSAAGSGSIALGVGAKANMTNIAIGEAADTSNAGRRNTAIGTASTVSGWDSIALGTQAATTANKSVALGNNSVADRDMTVSVGSASLKRQIVNVAAGTQDNDVVNLAQIKAAGLTVDSSGVATNSFVAYDDMTKGKITLAGGTNGTTITNLKAGSAAKDAVNVQQLTNATRYFKAGGANDGTDDATITGSGIAAGLKASADANGVAIGVGAIASNVSGGTYASVAIGRGTSATGGNATAVGDKANAAAGGTAVGDNASAKVARAVAIGEGAGASNESSIAVGTKSTVSGDYATALGVQATSTQNSAVALGANAASTGVSAVAIGGSWSSAANAAQASGTGSVALGYKASAAGNSAVALGQATATADNTVALGAGSLADRTNTVSVGKSGAERQVVNVAKGTQNTDAVNVQQLKDAGLTTDTSGVATNSFVAYDDTTKSKVTLGGTSSTTITNLKAGSLAAGSTDAVTGDQLHATNTNVSSNTTAIAGLDTRVTTNTTDIASAQSQLNAFDAAAVKYDSASKDTITLAGTSGTTITNLKAGSLAAGSTDAVTGDQLHTTNTNVSSNVAAIAGLDTRVTQNATDIGSLNTNLASNTANLTSAQAQLNALDDAAVKYDGASKDTIALAGTSGTTITNVKAGSIAAGSTDAATGGQLNTTNTNVASNTTAIASAQSQMNALDAVAVKYDSASKDTITLAGSGGTIISNVKAGAADTDAANVGQLKAAGLVDASGNTLSGVTYDTSAKDTITLAGTSGTTLTNLKAGSLAAGSTDAVTGDQLHTTNTNVSSNTTAIAGLDTRVTQNATNIGSLNTDLASNTSNLASAQTQLNALDGAAVKYDSTSKDTLTLAGTNGTTITNVKAGVADTDAANVGQLKAAGVVDASGNAASVVAYDSTTKDTLTLAGTNGTTITNLKAGSIAAGSTDAVTGDQLNTTNTNVSSNTTAIAGLDTRVTQNATDIGSLNTDLASNTANLASAQTQLNALDGAAVKYASASKDTIALAGTAGTTISNVKAGVADTDAANVGQLKAAGVVDASGNAASVVAYDSATKETVTLAGGTAGTTITNLKAGSLAAGSTDAVTGDQLNTTNTNVSSNTTAIAGLDTRVTQNATDIGGLNTSVTANTTNLASAQAQLNVLDGVAAKYDSTSKDLLTLAGTSGTTITNLKAGSIAAGSTDAVTGDQLNTTNTNVSSNTTAVTGLDTRVTQNATDIGSLNTNLASNTANLTSAQAQLNALDGAAVKYDSASKDTIALAGTTGTTITNVKAGVADTDAANVGQLKAAGVVDASGNAAAVVAYDSATKDTLTLAGTSGTTITNLKAGSIAAGSTDAVTGDQLNTTNTNVSSNTTAIAGLDTRVTQNASDIGSLNTSVTANTTNLASAQAQLNALDGAAVKYDAASKDTLTLAGATGTTISNVKAGLADTDAVNVSQLKASGLVDASGNAVSGVTYDAGVNKSAVTFAGVGGTQLKNVAAATDDTDAVNLAQLKSSGLVDSHGNALEALTYDTGSNKGAITLKGTDGTIITNVKSGRLAADSSDAVNGAQLFALAGNTSDSYIADNGSGVKYARSNDAGLAPDDAHAQGIGSTAVGYAATASANDALALGRNAQASFANSVALGAGSATTVGAQANYAAFGLAMPQSSAGEVNVGNRQITGVAAGSADQDAVNVAQLKSVDAKVDGVSAAVAQADKNALKYDDASQAKVTLGGAGQAHAPVTIANVAKGTVSADSTEAVNGSQLFDLQNAVVNSASNAAQVASIVAVGGTAAGDVAQASGTHAVAVGANTSASGNNSAALGANATASANNSTAIGTGATASHDNAVAIGANSTTDRENSVSVGSVGGERQIANVAAGTQANDAVNLSQMQGAVAGGVAAANAHTDARFNQAKRDAYAGTAAAMAIAGLPQATLPGRGMMAVAGSTYHGESAVAMGVSAISESGRFAVKVTGSTNGHGDYGVTAGAGVHW